MKIVTLISLLLTWSIGNAADDVAKPKKTLIQELLDAQSKIASIQDTELTANEALKKEQETLNTIESDLAQANKDAKETRKKYITGTKIPWIWDSIQVHPEHKANLDKYENQVIASKTALKIQQSALKKTKTDVESMYKELKNAQSSEADLKDKINSIKKQLSDELINVKFLLQDFSIHQEKAENVGLKLEILRDRYDHSNLGKYLQAKMAMLMNSPQYCKSISECSKDEKSRKKTSDADINDVFPGLNKEQVNTSGLNVKSGTK